MQSSNQVEALNDLEWGVTSSSPNHAESLARATNFDTQTSARPYSEDSTSTDTFARTTLQDTSTISSQKRQTQADQTNEEHYKAVHGDGVSSSAVSLFTQTVVRDDSKRAKEGTSGQPHAEFYADTERFRVVDWKVGLRMF